jgi:CRP-like cAMP-binding protein/FixJ family two-component response regulator
MNVDVDLSQITALIVDDSRYARSFTKTALQSFGIKTILEAADGPAGMEILAQKPVHLVIVDHDMAPMSGIDFARYVRSGDMAPCVDVILVMVSGDAAKEVVVSARNAGVNEFLVKPMSADSLFRRIRSALCNPKAFVRTETYTGPDRRVMARPPPGVAERRIAPPLPKARPLIAPPGSTLPGGQVVQPVQLPKPKPVERTSRKTFVSGQVIFKEGDRGDQAYVVERGSIDIIKVVDGARVVLGTIGPNGIFGEMALIDNQPRMAAAVAAEETVCMLIPKEALRAQIGKTPDLVILVLETLLQDIRRMGKELGAVRAMIEQRRMGLIP